MNRLFVALTNESFNDFKRLGKTYEIRAYGRQFTECQVYRGRAVELRRGYSTPDRLWGVIGNVIIGDLDKIFSNVPLGKISPRSSSTEEAMRECISESGWKDGYIAFEVLFH